MGVPEDYERAQSEIGSVQVLILTALYTVVLVWLM